MEQFGQEGCTARSIRSAFRKPVTLNRWTSGSKRIDGRLQAGVRRWASGPSSATLRRSGIGTQGKTTAVRGAMKCACAPADRANFSSVARRCGGGQVRGQPLADSGVAHGFSFSSPGSSSPPCEGLAGIVRATALGIEEFSTDSLARWLRNSDPVPEYA
jgi:hypothetical protein